MKSIPSQPFNERLNNNRQEQSETNISLTTFLLVTVIITVYELYFFALSKYQSPTTTAIPCFFVPTTRHKHYLFDQKKKNYLYVTIQAFKSKESVSIYLRLIITRAFFLGSHLIFTRLRVSRKPSIFSFSQTMSPARANKHSVLA